MKKNSFLSITSLVLLMILCSESHAQTATRIKTAIVQSNKNFLEWFNSGKLDSITSLYAEDACLGGRGCGKDFIREYYKVETKQYTVLELTTSEITTKDNVAFETGRWRIQLSSGEFLSGRYSSEWHLQNKKWVIAKESMPTADQ